jgi:hypothetical protein
MAITPLADGGYVETTPEALPFPFLYLHVQKYDAAGNPVGERHSFYPAGGGDVYALPNGGYVLAYSIAGGGHGPQSTALYVFDATSAVTDSTVFGQSYVSNIVISSDAFAVGLVHPAFSTPETDGAFSIRDLSGHLIVGATIDNAPTISLLANGDFSISWTDDGGDAHTLIVDPQNPPSPPEPLTVTALDDVGPVQGPIDIITDDPTPTIRVAVDEIGFIETGMGFFGDRIAVTADDAALGYKDIEIGPLTGAGGFGMQLRFQDANGLLTGWTFVSFDFDPLAQVLFGNDTPGQVLTGGAGNDVFYAGHNAVVMTSGGGADVFVFEHLPWNGGRITDFALGFDRLDFTDLFAAIGYGGFDPVADGYMSLESDGHGGTRVYFDPDGPGSGNPWPFLMTTLEGVSPVGLMAPTLFHPFLFPPGPLTLIADDTRDQVLTGGNASDIFRTGHNSVVMTGGGSDDTFVFEHVPWNNSGHITDFQVAYDRLDLSAVFAAVGYTGSDPIADGYIRLESDGAGGTRIQFDADGFGSGVRWPSVITTLDHLAPEFVTWQMLASGYVPEPPGLVLTGDDTRGQVLNGGGGPDIFYAGHNSVIMTGNGSYDRFVFDHLPWNAGHITDFQQGLDLLDLSLLFDASGYEGVDPIGDGYLRFESDGAGGTNVRFDPDGPATGHRWPFLIVTLDNVQPGSVTTNDWIY